MAERQLQAHIDILVNAKVLSGCFGETRAP
jgi:hypothetical protein